MFDLFREIGQTLRNNRLRTLLTGISVAWGIFMLIVLLGMSRGVFNAMTANSDMEASRSITAWPGMTSKPYKGYKEGRSVKVYKSDIDKIVADNRQWIEDGIATVSIDTAKVIYGAEYLSKGLNGVYPRNLAYTRATIIHGRYINDLDVRDARKSIVISERTATILFGDPSVAVGKRVSSMGLSWNVVGVYRHRWEDSNFVPFSTIVALTGKSTEVDNINFRLAADVSEEGSVQAEQDVLSSFARTKDFDPDDSNAVYLWNRLSQYYSQLTARNILLAVIWIIGLLSLLSGIVGVSNIMFVSVKERTHEIGIRRAIGAKPRSILLQIIAESVAITGLFGYIGLVFGMVVTEIINVVFGQAEMLRNPTVNLSIAIEVTVVLIIVGALAGLFPALKATKVRPVEALRDE